jgi:hypothetical protein
MYRWSACPGSVRLCKGLPNKSSVYAEEGSDAHALGGLCILNDFQDPHDYVDRQVEADGRKFTVDAEMAEAVQVYVDYAHARRYSGEPVEMFVEKRFDLSSVYPGCYGTSDLVFWYPRLQLLEDVDYKHGAGRPVSVKGNVQLRYYGLGALIQLGLPAKRVRLNIVQPRYDHPDGAVRTEELDAIELMDFRTDLRRYAAATEAPDAPLVPGDHCDFCPAKRLCPALQAAQQAIARAEFSPVTAYDPQELANALALCDPLEARIKGIREFAYAEAEEGRPPPGWKLVDKEGRRYWVDPAAAEKAALALAKDADSVYEPRKFKSPAQIEKTFGKKPGEAFTKEHAKSKSSGHVLVPENHPRPAVTRVTAQDELAAIPQQTQNPFA